MDQAQEERESSTRVTTSMENPTEAPAAESASSSHEQETKEEEKACDDASTTKEEEKARDDEGLLLEGYDVIVCGTGLVQSIVASALARAGKSVLHLDGAGNYGELDTVWNLSSIMKMAACQSQNKSKNSEPPKSSSSSLRLSPNAIPLSAHGASSSLKWHSHKKVTSFGINVGTHVQTPYGTGIVKAMPDDDNNARLAISLDRWKLADGTSPVAYFGTATAKPKTIDDPVAWEDFLSRECNIRSLRSIRAETILKNERTLALDATPAFILAAGRAVEGMLASGVADYLEFKPLEGLYWLESKQLSRVPCQKNDVFGTKLLAPMEKRRLMKFIQLSMDYATKLSVAEEMLKARNKNQLVEATTTTATATDSSSSVSPETEVQSLNERHLNQGRSLARPQNKAVATDELLVLQKCMENKMSFDDFLSQNHKLSPKLRAIVRYALALETSNTSTSLSQGMSSLRHHLQALGRYGTTAFLVPMYGSGELSQAFCRSAAVFGATYLLRRAPMGIDIDEESNNKVAGVFVAGEDQSNDNDDQNFDYDTNAASQQDKRIPCSQVVVPVGALPSNRQTSSSSSSSGTPRILRRISILNGKLIPSDTGDQRHVIFIPPQSIGNSHVIQCVLLDDSVQVAPPGCTLLHLTTTTVMNEESSSNDNDDDSILEKACQLVLAAKETEGSLDEIYHVTFSHDLLSSTTAAAADDDETATTALPDGVHLCSHSGQVLTADVAFEQAQKIFARICPGMEFLGLSDELDTAVKERAAERGYEDEERLMLESALGMIGATPPTISKEEEEEEATTTNETQELGEDKKI